MTPPQGPGGGPVELLAGVTVPRTIDELLAETRRRIRRVGPDEASAALERQALLVDIRPAAQRAAEGEIPGAVVIERNVLEWRLDPASPSRLPNATDHDVEIIVFCSEGYASSLAVAGLCELGLRRVADLDGGFKAWRDSGRPVSGGPGPVSGGPGPVSGGQGPVSGGPGAASGGI